VKLERGTGLAPQETICSDRELLDTLPGGRVYIRKSRRQRRNFQRKPSSLLLGVLNWLPREVVSAGNVKKDSRSSHNHFIARIGEKAARREEGHKKSRSEGKMREDEPWKCLSLIELGSPEEGKKL